MEEEPGARGHATVQRRARGNLGPLRVYRVSAISNAWVHSQCAAWSPEARAHPMPHFYPLS
jgi:hypothetical protein